MINLIVLQKIPVVVAEENWLIKCTIFIELKRKIRLLSSHTALAKETEEMNRVPKQKTLKKMPTFITASKGGGTIPLVHKVWSSMKLIVMLGCQWFKICNNFKELSSKHQASLTPKVTSNLWSYFHLHLNFARYARSKDWEISPVHLKFRHMGLELVICTHLRLTR